MFHNIQTTDEAFTGNSLAGRFRDHDEAADHQFDYESIESKAQDFARMCKAYEIGERILFKLDSFGSASINRGLELLQNSGLVAQSVELQTGKIKHRSFDSYVVLVQKKIDGCTSARTASFRASMSYCRCA